MNYQFDIDDILRNNLRRLLLAKEMKQTQLAALIGVTPSVVNDILGGRTNIGKDILARLCRELQVEPWEFLWLESTPIVMDPQEWEALFLFRAARYSGVGEEMLKYGQFMLSEIKNRQESKVAEKKTDYGKAAVPIGFSSIRREALHLYEMAIQQGYGEEVDQYVKKLIEKAPADKQKKKPAAKAAPGRKR